MENSILVMVTDFEKCVKSIANGARIAKDSNKKLFVLAALKEEAIKDKTNRIQTLCNVAGQYNAEITIYFSDNPKEAVCKHLNDNRYEEIIVDDGGLEYSDYFKAVNM